MQWEELSHIHESSNVKLRGFLYQYDEETWVLAKNPHLKHCCVGKIENDNAQVFLEGKFPDVTEARLVTFTGYLETTSQGFLLKEATLSNPSGKIPFGSFSVLFSALLLFLAFFRKRNK